MDGTSDVTAFILAGGKSSRMGTEKAFVEFEGRTLLARALELARSVASQVYIVGDRAKFADFAPVIEDIFRECGPLGGIHAALLASRTELNLILAVDTPFISRGFLQYLISQAAKSPEAIALVPHCSGYSHPLCAVYRPAFAAAAEAALRAGSNRIDRLFSEVRSRILSQDEIEAAGFSAEIFRNLNTPEELEAETLKAPQNAGRGAI